MRQRKVLLTQFPLFIVFFLLLVFFVSAQSFEAMKALVKTHVLRNGMKFIVLEKHEAPIVSFHVYADVGSANEVSGITGISHLLEHMAFKGTKVVGTTDYAAESGVLDEQDTLYEEIAREKAKSQPDPSRLKELEEKFAALDKKAKEYVINNEYFDMMMKQGDQGVNAYTTNDATQYINSLPSNRLEFWMAMTSDRFLNPVFREFYKERDVVMEERRLGLETQPMGKLMEDFFAAAFKAHPYRHDVVGHMSDLRSITRRDTYEYFKKYYNPSNLTVGIVGDIDPEEVFRMADLYFARIPSGPKPEPVRTIEPEQWGERRVTVEAQAQPMLLIGYHRPDSRHKDSDALDALANILGQGRSSRLYQALVKDKKAAVNVQSFNGFPGDKFPNLIAFFAVPAAGRASAECLSLIEEEIEKVKKDGVSADELTKFKRGEIKNLIGQMRSHDQLAALLTYADVVQGDWKKIFDRLPQINAVTVEDVRRVATVYLRSKNRTTGELIPEKSAPASPGN